jgi:hypothetical protein
MAVLVYYRMVLVSDLASWRPVCIPCSVTLLVWLLIIVYVVRHTGVSGHQ